MMIVTERYLQEHPTDIFVYGDNLLRQGTAGGAVFRLYHNTYGFVTKKFPDMRPGSFYTPEEYLEVYQLELAKLRSYIHAKPQCRFLISQLGGGLANRHHIWEQIIQPRLRTDLQEFGNRVLFLWEAHHDHP